MKDELWDEIVSALRSGTYNPSPHNRGNPKAKWVDEAGINSVPADRILYQALADMIAPLLDPQLDGGPGEELSAADSR